MGALIALFLFSIVLLGFACVVYACRGGCRLTMAIISRIKHEIIMRPKTRYYFY